ncbi:hypothetical protein ACJX0J_015161, partial [Zea mays]
IAFDWNSVLSPWSIMFSLHWHSASRKRVNHAHYMDRRASKLGMLVGMFLIFFYSIQYLFLESLHFAFLLPLFHISLLYVE